MKDLNKPQDFIFSKKTGFLNLYCRVHGKLLDNDLQSETLILNTKKKFVLNLNKKGEASSPSGEISEAEEVRLVEAQPLADVVHAVPEHRNITFKNKNKNKNIYLSSTVT
jgi:hypothetical protein